MRRDTHKIKTIYSLSDERRKPLRAQYEVYCFLSTNWIHCSRYWFIPKSMGWEFDSHVDYTVADHPDYYKNEITFLPYSSLEDIQEIINNNARWKFAREHGLGVRVEKVHDEMFPDGRCSTSEYIIIVECSDWNAFSNALRKDLHKQRKNEEKAEREAWARSLYLALSHTNL